MARATVSIGGYDLPEPSTYNATTSTLVDSGRNAMGVVVGAVVRDDVAKVEMKWEMLTADEWSRILKCFEPKFGGNFYVNVTFLNQVSNTWETRKMYCGDRKSGIFMRDNDSGLIRYRGSSLSLIEV